LLFLVVVAVSLFVRCAQLIELAADSDYWQLSGAAGKWLNGGAGTDARRSAKGPPFEAEFLLRLSRWTLKPHSMHPSPARYPLRLSEFN